MNQHSLRVIYAGTPDFSVPALEALNNSDHDVVAVYTQPDRRSGRGRKIVHSPVKAKALELELPVEQPVSLREAEAQSVLQEYKPDLMVVAAYGLLLPASVLDSPRYGCINIHASLLPRWRGAAPIQRAIAAGDRLSGITIMQMDEGLDTGDMLLTLPCDIDVNTTGAQLHDRLAILGVDALNQVVEQLVIGKLKAIPQDDTKATYAAKLAKSEAIINWSDSAVDIHRKICAYNGWPVAQTTLGADTLRVWESRLVADQANRSSHTAGQIEIIDDALEVATGAGSLRLTRVQAPGKKPVAMADFLNSRELVSGMLLGG